MSKRKVVVTSRGGYPPTPSARLATVQPPPKAALTPQPDQRVVDQLDRIAEALESIQTILSNWRDNED